jgi:hypothetical protein
MLDNAVTVVLAGFPLSIVGKSIDLISEIDIRLRVMFRMTGSEKGQLSSG